MPLIHKPSKKALQKNIETEMAAHPEKSRQKQNLAIAYQTQRNARKKKMADGGPVPQPSPKPVGSDEDIKKFQEGFFGKKMAHGGPVPAGLGKENIVSAIMRKNKHDKGAMQKHEEMGAGPEEDMEPMVPGRKPDEMRPSVDEIMSGRMQGRRMADGGRVDTEEVAEEMPNDFYKLNREAEEHDIYDEDQLSAQPHDSNEHADEITADLHDMVSKIRAKIKHRLG